MGGCVIFDYFADNNQFEMINQLQYLTTLFLILASINAYSQSTSDFIKNPSFEDAPRKGGYYNNAISSQRNKIKGWDDCGKAKFEGETAPDIHAEAQEFWKVKMLPSDGQTFLGLVVRDNYSWEEVSQELTFIFEAGRCYTFTIDLAKADPYISMSRLRKTNEQFNYNRAANLRIWGGKEVCDNYELLYVSPPIDNQEWRSYEVTIQPISDIRFVSLQAYYVDDSEPYNGNLLIDNISNFEIVTCEE